MVRMASNTNISDTNYNWLISHHVKAYLITSSSLSLVGCLIIIISYISYKDIRTSARHIIVCTSIADFLTSVSNLVAAISPKGNTVCEVQSFIGTTALCSSFLWTMMLALFLYLSLVKEKVELAKSLIFPWLHLICWFLPLTLNIIALLLHKLGTNHEVAVAGWCWIKVTVSNSNRSDASLWMFVDGKALELLTYLLTIIFYVQIKCHLSKKIDGYKKPQMFTSHLTVQSIDVIKTVDKKLIFVPVIFILLRMWGTIRFFMYVTDVENHHPNVKRFCRYLSLIQIFGDNLTGAANCILFCLFTPKVRGHVMRSCKKAVVILGWCCSCCCAKKQGGSVDAGAEDADDNSEGSNLRTRLM